MSGYVKCDAACSARAYVHVTLDTGLPLSWCGHHFREHEEALAPYVLPEFTVDDRDLLTAR